jgi:undecaprenyl-diphosphatase
MNVFQALVLGLVQGLGEFLPISSSAHLIIVPWLFGWRDPGLGFDVALHGGTLLAVVVYFRRDIWHLIKGFWHSLFSATRDLQNNIYQKLSWLLILASIPGAIFGKLFESKAETIFRNPFLIVITLVGFGLVLLFADRLGRQIRDLDKMRWQDALWVGLSQALAVIPGVSRSGSTMAAGLALGFRRTDAARFSFLMSIPIIFGAGLLKIGDFTSGVTMPELLVGFVSAAVFGFLAIKFLLGYLGRHNFGIFIWYRYALAALIILVLLARIF